MIKILISDADHKQNASCNKILSQSGNLKLFSTYTGKDTLKIYHQIQPNILILNTNIRDMKYIDIVKKLSILSIENSNCNIIVVLNNKEDICYMTGNLSKIQHVFEKEINYDELTNIINKMTNKLDENKLNSFLISLSISTRSEGSRYLKAAINECFDNIYMSDNLYSTIASAKNVEISQVRDGIRNSLKSIVPRNNEVRNFMDYYDLNNDMFPLRFIECTADYFKNHIKK